MMLFGNHMINLMRKKHICVMQQAIFTATFSSFAYLAPHPLRNRAFFRHIYDACCCN